MYVHTYIHINIFGSARGVMIIVEGNIHSAGVQILDETDCI